MCPTVVVLLDQREGMSRTETPRGGCDFPAFYPQVLSGQLTTLRNDFPCCRSLFGKAAVHSKPVIKVHSGNEKKMK